MANKNYNDFTSAPDKGILILDFGSQYTWLIARCLRELGVYSQVESFEFPTEYINRIKPAGIILSGGPSSVLSSDAPIRDLKSLLKIAPLMGVCYGFQLICHQWGGKIVSSHSDPQEPLQRRTYGSSRIYWKEPLLDNMNRQKVWMSHGDFVAEVPKGFSVLAETERQIPAVLKTKNILALQFHPEVSHTEKGKEILSYFTEKICGIEQGSWTGDSMFSLLKSQIREQLLISKEGGDTSLVQENNVGDTKEMPPSDSGKVLCALSGGVDSTVMACLLTKVLGSDRIHCVFVDTGLLRKGEFQEVLSIYKKLKLNVTGIVAEEKFLKALEGIIDPEQKRKIIGGLFIEIFKEYKIKHPDIKYLAQGTLYPDVIESLSFKGPSATIKSHHNVGGLPKKLPFKLVEPLRFLFKDEVRALGRKIQIPTELLQRHPFPGPGLAVRICGEITKERLQKLKKADAIFIEQLKQSGLYEKIWQAFAVLLPVKSVGVQGDQRTYDEVIVLRAITSTDGMTADWFSFPSDFLHKTSNHITNEVEGVNRVVYDITSKPPGTIEWL